MTTTIAFYNILHDDPETITYEDGVLTSDSKGLQRMADKFIEDGGTAEEFVAKFSDWTGGRSASRVVED